MAEEIITPAKPESSPIKQALNEITQPFIDLIKAPRALWGVILAYAIEGLSYFGILTYLAIYFSDFVFQGVAHPDIWSHDMVMVLTAGIAISMVVFGFVPDKYGVRKALILSFILLLIGRTIFSAAPTLMGLTPDGLWSLLHVISLLGILFMLLGYGIYQPAAYAAVRQFTTPKTASMGYAMLYAVMNLGSSLVMGAFLLRDEEYLNFGITGTFWVFTGLTLVSLCVTIFILSRRTVDNAIREAKADTADQIAELGKTKTETPGKEVIKKDITLKDIPITAWVIMLGILVAIYFRASGSARIILALIVLSIPFIIALLPAGKKQNALNWIVSHPLANSRFFFFIFALMPVQTLFTYNWLILPQYISRAYEGWIGNQFEVASNFNPILIFILVPVITAMTSKKNVYNMMVWGTLVMGSSAFILALGPNFTNLLLYLIMMSIGEAMWSARFLQYATEIAPEGKAGLYQGVAQLPWFLTKFLVPLLYSGHMMELYCPEIGSKNTSLMWLIFGFIAITTPIFLWTAKSWMIKGFKTKAEA
jgi:POT family proton-dependent oligopeptide transporter